MCICLNNDIETQYDDLLILDDVDVEIDFDPYINVPECIHKPISNIGCNPFELACDSRCQGAGICPMNPLSECYNMSLEDFRIYLNEIKIFESYMEEFLDSDEGKEMIEELKNVLNGENNEDDSERS